MIERRPLPPRAFYERFFMRVLFAWLVWRATPAFLNFYGTPSPNGLAHFVDFHFLLDPRVFAFCRAALAAALVLYVLRLVVWLALPVALFVNVATCTVVNSQGAIQHAYQIVSLVLLGQTGEHVYGLWRRRHGEVRTKLEERLIWWSQQTVVAVYLVAGITKLIVTKGLWIFQARLIAVSIAKTAYQSFYDGQNEAHLQQQLAVAHFAATHGWIVMLIAAGGLFLELASPLMLVSRWSAALLGCALLAFHRGLDYTMGLSFIFNQWLLVIYMINLPYWVVTSVKKFAARRSNHIPMI